MPIYEFISHDTGKIYSFFARSNFYVDKIPLCPDGKHFKMEKILSGFSITGKNEVSQEDSEIKDLVNPNDPFEGMESGKAEKVMKELEGAMGGLDENNPDPKHMGQLMRRMCEITGEKMDEPMEEVVRKLEEGTDPDELEAYIEGFAGDDDTNFDQSDEQLEKASAKNKFSDSKRIVHDPILYEFSEYFGS